MTSSRISKIWASHRDHGVWFLHQDHLVLVPNSFSLAPNFITFILPQTLASFVSCYNELLQKDTVSCRDFFGGVCKVGSTRERSEEPPRMDYNLNEIVLSGCFQGPHNISRQHIQTPCYVMQSLTMHCKSVEKTSMSSHEHHQPGHKTKSGSKEIATG
jgi:hypothetical protein